MQDSVPARDSLRLVRPPGADVVIAMLGNPNVGKSTLFNELTGLGVSTAHYPGTTRDVEVGETTFRGTSFTAVDLPGTYSLATDVEESWIGRRALLDVRPDVVIVVVDSANLARNVPLALEVLDLGMPCVIAVNLLDESRRAGLEVDLVRLAEMLGVPVVGTVATQGLGVDELVSTALMVRGSISPHPRYAQAAESEIGRIADVASRLPERPYGLTPRAFALQTLGSDDEFALFSEDVGGLRDVLAAANASRARLRDATGEPVMLSLSRERARLAEAIASECVARVAPRRGVDWWRVATSPTAGVLLMLGVLALVFVFLFFVGDMLAGAFASVWESLASPAIHAAVAYVFGDGGLARTLLWGLDSGLEASLSIGIPYILTFYVLLGVLEDSGYLNALAFLADRTMHRVGLHGHALVPLVAAAGCNVPALLAARSLPDRRERLIASTLVAMVPCSARIAVVLGAVGHFLGIVPALAVLGVVFVLWVGAGLGLNAMVPGSSGGLVMELFPFRRPSVRGVVRKAWIQFREFLFVATPIVVVGSLVLGGLYESGLLVRLADPMAPVVEGWLGLPAVAGLTLLIGTLRKELALQLLVVMAVAVMGSGAAQLTAFMTPTDLFVYALVNTIAVPCVSTIAVLAKEHGWWRAASIVAFTVIVGVGAGGAFARILPALGW